MKIVICFNHSSNNLNLKVWGSQKSRWFPASTNMEFPEIDAFKATLFSYFTAT